MLIVWKVDSLENLREVFIEKDAKKRRPEPGPTKLANIFRNKASEELCRGGDEVISSSRLSRMKIANLITAVHPTQSSFWLAVHLSSVQGRFVSREHVSKLSEPFIGDKNMCRYSETLKKLLDFRQKEEALV